MSGMVMLPVVTTSDTGLPDRVPYRALAMTQILAGPPRIRPAMEAASLKKKLPPPAALKTCPNSTNMNT